VVRENLSEWWFLHEAVVFCPDCGVELSEDTTVQGLLRRMVEHVCPGELEFAATAASGTNRPTEG
jgi:hypothetical protein